MPQGNVYSKFCNGNVLPSAFVKMDTTASEKVIACAATTDYPIGIAQEGAYQASIPQLTGTQYAGTTISPAIRIYGQGCMDILLTVGAGGWTAGDKLTSDANGAGVTAVAGNIYGAEAMETRSAGELGRVMVTPPTKM